MLSPLKSNRNGNKQRGKKKKKKEKEEDMPYNFLKQLNLERKKSKGTLGQFEYRKITEQTAVVIFSLNIKINK